MFDQGYTYKVLTRLLDWEEGAAMTVSGQDEGTEPFMAKHEQEQLMADMINAAVTKDDQNYRTRQNVDEDDDYDIMDLDEDQEDGGAWEQSGRSPSSSSSSSSSRGKKGRASYTVRRTDEGAGFAALSGASNLTYAEVDMPGNRR